jgi:hypothetical protein
MFSCYATVRIRFLVLALAGSTYFCFAATPRAAGGQVLDQAHTPQRYLFGAAVEYSLRRAQTFTVGQSGILDRVELQVWQEGNPTAPLVVEIRKTLADSGAPDPSAGALLASVSMAASLFSTDPYPSTYTGVDLNAQSFAVSAGDVLAIVATSTIAYPQWYLWTTSDSAATPPAPQYSGGMAFYAYPASAPWSASASRDSGFRTYVTIPEPSGMVLCLAGFATLTVCRWRKRRTRPLIV